MRKRIYAFLLSVCFILGMVQAGWAETGESFDEKIDKLWEKYGDKDFHWEAYEKLYFAMIEKTGGPDTADFALLPTLEQSLFIVLIMDMEIQNGGLAQFFWNNGSVYASLVPDALEEIGLEDVKKLYEDFIPLGESSSARHSHGSSSNFLQAYKYTSGYGFPCSKFEAQIMFSK